MLDDVTLRFLEGFVHVAQKHSVWDELPMLMVLHGVDQQELVVVPEGDLFDMLRDVAEALQEKIATAGPVTGLILMNEGWSISEDNAEAAQAVAEDLRRRGLGLADHPDAVEVKLFTAIDRKGVEVRKIERGIDKVQSLGSDVTGRVVDYLTTLFMELTA